jgi:hypothetical protein
VFLPNSRNEFLDISSKAFITGFVHKNIFKPVMADLLIEDI